MTETIGRLREVQRDRCIFSGRVADKLVQVRRDCARELVNGCMLVFHLHGHLGGLEDLLLIPGDVSVAVDIVSRSVLLARVHLPVVQDIVVIGAVLVESHFARILRLDGVDDVPDLEIVFLVENVVDRSETDVLVRSAVTRDVVIAYRRHHEIADGIMHLSADRNDRRSHRHRILDAEIAEIDPEIERAGAGQMRGRAARAHHVRGNVQVDRCGVGVVAERATQELGSVREGLDVGVEGRAGFGV